MLSPLPSVGIGVTNTGTDRWHYRTSTRNLHVIQEFYNYCDNPREHISTSFIQLYQIPYGHCHSPELERFSQYCVIHSLSRIICVIINHLFHNIAIYYFIKTRNDNLSKLYIKFLSPITLLYEDYEITTTVIEIRIKSVLNTFQREEHWGMH